MTAEPEYTTSASMCEPPFEVSVQRARKPLDGRTELAIRGDIDLLTTPELQQVLFATVDGGHPRIVVDIGGVDFCDCRGFEVLAAATRRAQEAGCQLTIINPTPIVRRLFDLLEAERVLDLDGDGCRPSPEPDHPH